MHKADCLCECGVAVTARVTWKSCPQHDQHFMPSPVLSPVPRKLWTPRGAGKPREDNRKKAESARKTEPYIKKRHWDSKKQKINKITKIVTDQQIKTKNKKQKARQKQKGGEKMGEKSEWRVREKQIPHHIPRKFFAARRWRKSAPSRWLLLSATTGLKYRVFDKMIPS